MKKLTYRKPYKKTKGVVKTSSWVKLIREFSGVYYIRERGKLVYIGESHTGRLKKTMLRHFQSWERSFNAYDISGWSRHTGQTYDGMICTVAFQSCDGKHAAQLQYDEIKRLKPRDNEIGNSDNTSALALDLDY